MNIKKISLALLLTSTLFTPMAYAMDEKELEELSNQAVLHGEQALQIQYPNWKNDKESGGGQKQLLTIKENILEETPKEETSTLFTPIASAMNDDETESDKKTPNIVSESLQKVQEKVYKRILETKNSDLLLNWANLLLEDEEYEKALLSLQEVEKLEENFEVLFQLGQMYEEGKGVEKDENKAGEYYKKSFSFLKQSCERNDSSAIATLILIYGELRKEACQKGLFKEVKPFYLKQAQLIGQLANMYEKGINIEKDSKTAMIFYGDQKNLYLDMYLKKFVGFDEIKKFLLRANNNFFRLQKELN
jgi:TPR repeat protein